MAGALVSPNDTTVTHNGHTLFGKLYCECLVILFSLDDNQISSEFFKTQVGFLHLIEQIINFGQLVPILYCHFI